MAQQTIEAALLAKATEVFGTRDAEWFNRPAMALDYKRPAEMLTTPAGAESVERLLRQLEYCVYV